MLQNENQKSAQGKPNVMATSFRRAISAFVRHPQFKLIALAISIFIWGLQTFSGAEVMVEKVLTNVKISVLGQDVLRSRGYAISDDFTSIVPTVDIRVKVPWRHFSSVTGATYVPRIDLSALESVAGEQELAFVANSSDEYGEIVEITPAAILLHVEDYKSSPRIPVNVVIRGDNPDNLWFGEPVLNPQYIIVSGPASVVDEVRRAEAEIQTSDLSEERPRDTKNATITLFDAYGNAISSPLLRISNDSVTIRAIQVTLDVYPKKTLPVDTATAIAGTPAQGYELTNVTISPSRVEVAGPRDVINRLSAIYLSTPRNISGATGGFISGSELRRQADLAYVSHREVVISALIQPQIRELSFSSLPVGTRNLSAALKAEVDPVSIGVTVSGNYFDIEELAESQVSLFVELEGLAEGVHVLDVLCQADNVRAFSYQPQQRQVQVTITKR